MSQTLAANCGAALTYAVAGPKVLVWATCRTSTDVTENSGTVTCGAGDVVLLTVMGWEAPPADVAGAVTRLRTAQSAMLRVSAVPSGGVPQRLVYCNATITVCCAFNVADCSDEWTALQRRDIAACRKSLVSFFDTAKIRLRGDNHLYLAPAAMQMDFTDSNGNLALCGGLGGWPQLNRLSFDAATYWVRAVALAVLMTEADVGQLVDPAFNTKAYRVLVCSALTAFAGNYPAQRESSDDRSLGPNKLGTNIDCDDMAMTTVAAATYLRRIGAADYTTLPNMDNASKPLLTLSSRLHAFLCSYYTGAAVIICKAMPKAANPNLNVTGMKPIGHVAALLITTKFLPSMGNPNMFKDGDLIETTRQSYPFCGKLRTISPHFKRTSDWSCFQKGPIQDMKPLIYEQYPTILCAHTPSHTYVAVNPQTHEIGGSLKDMSLGGNTQMHRLPMQRSTDAPDLRNLAHYQDLDTIDKRCAEYKWHEQLNVPSRGTLPGATGIRWGQFGSPGQLGAGYNLSHYCGYAFVGKTAE